MINPYELDAFTRAYLEAALWSSTDTEGVELDLKYGVEDFTQAALKRAIEDCAAFQVKNADMLSNLDLSDAGHDFWLTRNRHGAGFWDGDYSEGMGKVLTDSSHSFGEVSLFVTSDNKIEME